MTRTNQESMFMRAERPLKGPSSVARESWTYRDLLDAMAAFSKAGAWDESRVNFEAQGGSYYIECEVPKPSANGETALRHAARATTDSDSE
ncbi:MAG: hypothetical protein ACRCYU_24280 [Nocardioides sp.]